MHATKRTQQCRQLTFGKIAQHVEFYISQRDSVGFSAKTMPILSSSSPTKAPKMGNNTTEATAKDVVAVETFDYEKFNEIADYHAVRHIGEEEKEFKSYVPKINEIGQVFLDHKLNEFVSLSLTHRHFHLQPGEIKVARQHGNIVRIVAEKFEPELGKTLVPYMFKVEIDVHKEPRLIPLEYVELRNNSTLLVTCKAEFQAIQNKSFLRDFAKVLEEQDVQNIFGLVLNSKDDILVKDTETKLESGGGGRSLIVRAMPRSELGEEIVTMVAWRFREGSDGKIVPVGTCMSTEHGENTDDKCKRHCKRHCRHPPPIPPICYSHQICAHNAPSAMRNGEPLKAEDEK